MGAVQVSHVFDHSPHPLFFFPAVSPRVPPPPPHSDAVSSGHPAAERGFAEARPVGRVGEYGGAVRAPAAGEPGALQPRNPRSFLHGKFGRDAAAIHSPSIFLAIG